MDREGKRVRNVRACARACSNEEKRNIASRKGASHLPRRDFAVFVSRVKRADSISAQSSTKIAYDLVSCWLSNSYPCERVGYEYGEGARNVRVLPGLRIQQNLFVPAFIVFAISCPPPFPRFGSLPNITSCTIYRTKRVN